MPRTTFEPGDVVVLKSGGPSMTVVLVAESDLTCMWYAEEDEEYRRAEIPSVAVTAVELDDDLDDEDDEDEDDE
jgi:uncharacterized protein YodC (DUF2158 family)